MISILTLCSNPDDCTSFYRGINPIGRLKQATGTIEVLLANKVSWNETALSDVAFFQRPCSEQHAGLANLIKEWGVPLWLDYDDDVLNVSEDNPSYPLYSKRETISAIRHCISVADHITVTTEDLRRKLSSLNPNVSVIPNALDDTLLRYRDPKPRNEVFTILWRGTRTHKRDVETVQDQIIEAVRETGSRIYFQGMSPKRIVDALPPAQCVVNEFMLIWDYFRFIHDMVRPNLTIVPLEDTTFNRSKSNIAWMESVFAGAPALAPDWEEWRKPGCINYTSPEDFKEKLLWLTQSPDECRKQAELGWEYVQKNLRLGDVNAQRWDVLDQLMTKTTRTKPPKRARC